MRGRAKISGWCVLVGAGLLLTGGPAHADGAATFKAKCVMCHGADAKGNPAMAAGFKVDLSALNLTKAATTSKSKADLTKIISEGRAGRMPAWRGRLSPAEIDGVVSFIKK